MSEITFKRILKLHKDTWNNSKTIIQVVQWGNNKPSIEKRDYYKKDGEWITGKCRSFSLEDFKILLKNKEEIKEALKNG